MRLDFRRALVVLLFFNSFSAFASALDHEWLSLLRYNKYGASYFSEADDPRFFLSPNGKSNPAAEYDSLIRNLAAPAQNDQHAACRFPARSLKLWRDGALPKPPDFKNCDKLQRYLRATNAKSASLVFAGYFIQKPSSAFGHSFLRLHTNQQGNAALLDFAVDFSATINTSNPIAYGVKGIIGGFPGRFSRMPYFLKLREYADLESRDVWEYPLNLSKHQTTQLVLHLWEMDSAYFDYYYFSENCSYHILRAIEAISQTQVSDKLKFFVTPLDTIFALQDAGLLGAPSKRPSQYSILSTALKELSPKQREIATQFLNKPLEFNQVFPDDPVLLDTFIEIINYRFAEELLTDRPRREVSELRHKLLLARSKLGHSLPIQVPSSNDPARGHRGSWFEASFRLADQPGLQLEHAIALHSFKHSSPGFSNRFQMIMGRTQIFVRDNNITVDRIDLFDVLSASNSFSWDFKPSWRFAVGMERSYYDESEKLVSYALVSSGLSYDFLNNLLLTFNFDFKPRNSHDHSSNIKLPAGFSSNLVYEYKNFRFGQELFLYREFIIKKYEYGLEPFIRFQTSKSIDLNLSAKLQRNKSLYQLGITYFY